MDKYDEQIEKLMSIQDLVERQKAIENDWFDGIGLFQFCTPDGKSHWGREACDGCLSMIRSSSNYAATRKNNGLVELDKQLTNMIRSDTRIPDDLENIQTREQLEVFAEWQRKLDKEIRDSFKGQNFQKVVSV